jgi:hypothetical protein
MGTCCILPRVGLSHHSNAAICGAIVWIADDDSLDVVEKHDAKGTESSTAEEDRVTNEARQRVEVGFGRERWAYVV